MKPEIYIPLLSGFIGALIGALASIVTVWIQARTQDRNARLKLASDLALEDYKISIDILRSSGRPYQITPIALHLHYHLELMQAMEKGSITVADVHAIAARNKEILQALEADDAGFKASNP